MAQKMIMAAFCLVICGISAVSYAEDSSDPHLVQQFKPQEQQPTTNNDAQVPPVRVVNNQGGSVTCPAGFALTVINAQRQTATRSEYTCPVVAALGVGVATCGIPAPLIPTSYYYPVTDAPEMTYSCKKIVNVWQPVPKQSSSV